MATYSGPNPELPVVQFFYNDYEECKELAEGIKRGGYRVVFVPTSGSMAIWIDECEIVGATAIRGVMRQLLQQASDGEALQTA